VFEPATDRAAAQPPASKELIGRAMAASPKYRLELLPPALRAPAESKQTHHNVTKWQMKDSMPTQSTDLKVNPADETIRLGPLALRFLVTGENSGGSVAVFEMLIPAGERLMAPAHSHDH
jgi:hypothetical protein